MYKLSCLSCEEISYSATNAKWLIGLVCPYCGGQIADLDDQEVLKTRVTLKAKEEAGEIISGFGVRSRYY